MKARSVIGRTFYRRPRIRDLVPDLKLVLSVLTVGCESHVGCWVPAGLREDCGLSGEAFDGAIRDLERRGHIIRDENSGEYFLSDFFRDNDFSTPARKRQAEGDYQQIVSMKLKAAVRKAALENPSCCLSSQNFYEKSDGIPTFVKKQEVNRQGEGEGKAEGKGAAAEVSAELF
jgi:hypothetical protein